ncbi:hypothetical protein PGT21_015172 [Puccinia graminis f. sp. tritici]|uniref:Uncharacterized protein n=1 Tax=Puccinia graminis f. sp. tritici TaxID=56615 RepID=A0A5B0LQ00_PUCGR|nr:hypothetical protein PGT21_015172 [Puccinia graminis f. sp. tritici]
MNATIYALLCLAAAAANVATVGEKMKCFTYSAGTKGYSCNDRSDIICTEGCKTFAKMADWHPDIRADADIRLLFPAI